MLTCRKLLLAPLLPAWLVACSGDGDPRLQDSWRSDKALTLAHLSPDEEEVWRDELPERKPLSDA
jgi:hypothetical protein